MPYALVVSGDSPIAGMTDGHLFQSSDDGESWSDAGFQGGSVLAMAAA